MSYGDNVPAPGGAQNRFAADEIILYGLKLNLLQHHASLDLSEPLTFGPAPQSLAVRMQLWGVAGALPNTEVTIAAVYGYAFEGHCFRPDKVRIYAFPYSGPDLPASGCGFDETGQIATNGYRMWRIKQRTPLLELSASVGTAESLILEANLPGKRAPNTYDSRMQLSHRGGRVTNT